MDQSKEKTLNLQDTGHSRTVAKVELANASVALPTVGYNNAGHQSNSTDGLSPTGTSASAS